MAIILTNGKNYIATNKNGGVYKVTNIKQAQDFYCTELAMEQKKKASSKCAGYYCIDTDASKYERIWEIYASKNEKSNEAYDPKNEEINEAYAPKNEEISEASTPKKITVKRRCFSAKERISIYRKTKGHCYLCGDFIDFDAFEVDHKVPISKGGTNELDNLFCCCHCCNTIKSDIYPEDFMEKVSQIFLYQMRRRSRNSLKWKMIYRKLKRSV